MARVNTPIVLFGSPPSGSNPLKTRIKKKIKFQIYIKPRKAGGSESRLRLEGVEAPPPLEKALE